MKTHIGIDPSINSTGLVIRRGEEIQYYLVTSKVVKKYSQSVKQIPNNKIISDKDSDYSTVEMNKIASVENQVSVIKSIIEDNTTSEDELIVSIEGYVMNSPRFGLGRLLDLVALSTSIKSYLMSIDAQVNIVPPKSLKQRYAGNGNAKKEIMVSVFLSKVKDFDELGKIDDIADAHALSEWADETIEATPKLTIPKKNKK